MEVAGQYRFATAPEQLWQAICDPQVLKACIPQCDFIERMDETHWKGTASVKISFMKVSFDGLVTLSDLNPPHSYTIQIDSSSWVGKARGTARVQLVPEGDGTALSYLAEVHIGIKLLDKAMNLAEGLAKELADKFFARLAEQIKLAGK